MAEDAAPVRHSRLRVGILSTVTIAVLVVPYGLLAVLSMGSGWGFPHLLPERIDLVPWKQLAADRDGVLAAAGISLARGVTVGILATTAGLIAGRALRRRASAAWHLVAYLPFVLSPVIVGTCLYDLLIRVRLAGTEAGVLLGQSLFAFAYATVLFRELWTPRIDRAEQVVATLGGGRWAVWRHAVLPQASGTITVCLVQTALWSWLDYGIVSLVGGGRVKSLTMLLFAAIREASTNQAALSGLLLVLPAVAGFLATALLLRPRPQKANPTGLAPVVS